MKIGLIAFYFMSQNLSHEEEDTVYKGYIIEMCFDNTYYIMKNGKIFDTNYKTIDDAKECIDAQNVRLCIHRCFSFG